MIVSFALAVATAALGALPHGPVAEDASSPIGASTSTVVAADTARRPTAADVAFMQGMIGHHAQALVMTALVPERSSRPDLGLLAERITASQRDEITQMQLWLRDRGMEAPDPSSAHAHHDAAHPALMPGMLTPEEIAQLGAARGSAFDRLFLEFMIKHHEGALQMVADLRRSPGALQEPQLFDFASDVDADQRAEIARMRRLLATLPNG